MNKQIILENNKEILSSTDKKGIILDVNDYFCEISGFTQDELIGANHNIIRHPDMPKIIFKLMWESILIRKENFKGIIKNLTKDNNYYWVITDFIIEEVDGYNIYTARRRELNQNLTKRIEHIYKRLKKVEEENPKDKKLETSEKVLNDIIYTANCKNYEEFINYLIDTL